jgi:RNA polymerase sigma factor (sigma-70 family)
MKKSETDKIISEYVKKLFGFAVSKLNSIDEAEELAAEITLQVYKSLLKQDNISNINGYVYRIARNIYAQYIDKRQHYVSVDGMEYIADERDFTAELAKSENFGILRREITYLSKIQREIIVQHYFCDKKIREIATALSIPENTVKWHLACSRRELKIGMERIRTTGNLGTQPIKFIDMGHRGIAGKKGDTATFLAKSLTQNIAYVAYHQPRNINEIAEELGVNPIFVEDEVAVLEEYGYMDRQKDGRYLTNIHIVIPCEEANRIYSEINPLYARKFAEKFFAPKLKEITEIPEWLHIPDNDLNLFKWSLVCFMSHKLGTAEINDSKYSVKRPDGGDFAAYAVLGTDSVKVEHDQYWYCGDMWRNHTNNDVWWESWQLNCEWTDREGFWMDNLSDDYDKLYYFINGTLPEISANAESYRRLLDKGYLLKNDEEYKVNIILCDSEKKWWEFIPDTSEEINALSKEYAELHTKAELLNQPAHMHGQIRYYGQNSACALHTHIMEQLLDMGVLTLPTEKQAKGLCTVMFVGE